MRRIGMIRTGQVVEVRNNLLMICFERLEACQNCGACMTGKHTSLVAVEGEAQAGDAVDVEMPDSKVVKASALAYMIPLAGLLAGLIAGSELFSGSDAAMLISGLLCMFISWLGLRLIDKHLGRKKEWKPRVIAVRRPENLA
jgi:sigma-E factor negative regulatory protein RseC